MHHSPRQPSFPKLPAELNLSPELLPRDSGAPSVSGASEQSLNAAQSVLRADPVAALFALAESGIGNQGTGGVTIHSCLSHIGLPAFVRIMQRLESERQSSTPPYVSQEHQLHALWVHSIETAVAARFIAEESSSSTSCPEEAYLFGLLHDIGRFALLSSFPMKLEAVDKKGWQTPTSLLLAEREVLGTDHSEVGFQLCTNLGLPERMSRLIHRHHDYYSPKDELGSPYERSLLRLVQMADSFSVLGIVFPEVKQMSQLDLAEEIELRCVHPCWTDLPLEPWELASFADRIWEESGQYLSASSLKDVA